MSITKELHTFIKKQLHTLNKENNKNQDESYLLEKESITASLKRKEEIKIRREYLNKRYFEIEEVYKNATIAQDKMSRCSGCDCMTFECGFEESVFDCANSICK